MDVNGDGTLQIFARLLNGKTRVLRFGAGRACGHEIKERIAGITGIPCSCQRLIHGGSQLDEESVVLARDSTVHLVARLPGGKGGFGSLLRGAATKPGHKKTNNFDACRDMSGRRLRHVNAEKRLEEWKAEEDERRLERVAEEFIKKEAKRKGAGKAGAADRAAAKYVEGYREQSAKCVEEVEEAVKEACALAVKRKGKALLNAPSDAKKLKIWMGKRKMGESDSEDDSNNEDDGQENGKSTVTSNGNHADLKAEADASSDSVTGGGLGGQSSGGVSSKSGSDSSEEEKEAAVERPGVLAELVSSEVNDVAQPDVLEDALQKSSGLSGSQAAEVCCNKSMKSEDCSNILQSTNLVGETLEFSGSGTKSEAHAVAVARDKGGCDSEKPLNFDEFSSAADLEVLGMEKLKTELQARGLKCGGTLPERAARLFLLKSTPLEKLPKKLLAKK